MRQSTGVYRIRGPRSRSGGFKPVVSRSPTGEKKRNLQPDGGGLEKKNIHHRQIAGSTEGGGGGGGSERRGLTRW